MAEEESCESDFEDQLLQKYFPQQASSLQVPHHHANRARVVPREFARQFLELLTVEPGNLTGSDDDRDIDICVESLKIMSIKDRVNAFVEKSVEFVNNKDESLLKRREMPESDYYSSEKR
jgi:hypothetical protein